MDYVNFKMVLSVLSRPLKGSRNAVLVNVTVTNLFNLTSTVNETLVNSAVEDAINNENMSYVYSYKGM